VILQYKNTLQDYLDPAWYRKVLQQEDTCPRCKNLYRTEKRKTKNIYICNRKRNSRYVQLQSKSKSIISRN